MHIPTPIPGPLVETTGRLTLSVTVFLNVDLDAAAVNPELPFNGAQMALLVDEALMGATLPDGCTALSTLLQLAIHAPR